MTVLELVAKLREYYDLHGNHEVIDSYDNPIKDPEEVDGFCVLAENA